MKYDESVMGQLGLIKKSWKSSIRHVPAGFSRK